MLVYRLLLLLNTMAQLLETYEFPLLLSETVWFLKEEEIQLGN